MGDENGFSVIQGAPAMGDCSFEDVRLQPPVEKTVKLHDELGIEAQTCSTSMNLS